MFPTKVFTICASEVDGPEAFTCRSAILDFFEENGGGARYLRRIQVELDQLAHVIGVRITFTIHFD